MCLVMIVRGEGGFDRGRVGMQRQCRMTTADLDWASLLVYLGLELDTVDPSCLSHAQMWFGTVVFVSDGKICRQVVYQWNCGFSIARTHEQPTPRSTSPHLTFYHAQNIVPDLSSEINNGAACDPRYHASACSL